jgi:hypothetical protein
MLFLILPSTTKKITAAMQRHGARASRRAQKISHGGDAQTNGKQKKKMRAREQHTLCQDKVVPYSCGKARTQKKKKNRCVARLDTGATHTCHQSSNNRLAVANNNREQKSNDLKVKWNVKMLI